jgi:hypothetical protein
MEEEAMSYLESLRLEEVKSEEFGKEIYKNIPKGIDLEKVLTAIVSQSSTPEFLLDCIEENVFRKYIAKNTFDQLEAIYNYLIENKHDKENEYEFNDMDDHVSYLDCNHKDRKVIYHRSQNCNLLYIWESNPGLIELLKEYNRDYRKLHIRQVWDDYKTPTDEFDLEDAEEYKEKGITWAIRNAQWLKENFSDCVEDNPYPERFNLEHYAKNNYEPRYGDARDSGFIISYGSTGEGRNPSKSARTVLDCFIPSILTSLEEDYE